MWEDGTGTCASDPEMPEIRHDDALAPGHRAWWLVRNELCGSEAIKDRFIVWTRAVRVHKKVGFNYQKVGNSGIRFIAILLKIRKFCVPFPWHIFIFPQTRDKS
jgi:hypothetical protein